MDCFQGSPILWKHAVAKFLGGEIVESGMERGRIDLSKQLLECIMVGVLLVVVNAGGCAEKAEENRVC